MPKISQKTAKNIKQAMITLQVMAENRFAIFGQAYSSMV